MAITAAHKQRQLMVHQLQRYRSRREERAHHSMQGGCRSRLRKVAPFGSSHTKRYTPWSS
jgi:hypothetical protein